MTTIRFTSLPKTQPPPASIEKVVAVFRHHEASFATKVVNEALDSNGVLSILRPDLVKLGFHVEESKYKAGEIERPVFQIPLPNPLPKGGGNGGNSGVFGGLAGSTRFPGTPPI